VNGKIKNINMKISPKIIKYGVWVPRGLSLILVMIWVLQLVLGKLQTHQQAGIIITIIIFLTTAIAWKNSPIGGGLLIILASLYLVLSMNNNFPIGPILGSIPLFIIGALFIIEYLYLEKEELDSKKQGEDDF